MKIKPLESEDNLTLRSSHQPRPHRFTSLLASLLVTAGVGYFIWREMKLNAAQQLVQDCIEQQNCAEHISALEQLVKGKRSLQLLNLESTDLSNAHLESANLESANLESANLSNAHLEKANLKKANLSITQIVSAHLEKAHLEKANLSNAHLESVYLINAHLEGAYLSHAHLQGAYFNRAHFQDAHFYHADLTQAYFHRANLSRTYFYRTNFDQANFYGANLSGASLMESQNLTPTQIKSACNWDKAVYQGVWQLNQFRWVVDEKANQQFIQQLKQDKDSDPKQPVDCSQWI